MSERLTIFLKSVTDFADEECRELETKAQTFKEENISKYKHSAERGNQIFIEHETSRIYSRVNREISAYEAEKKTALTRLRSSLTEKVFDEVKEKIGVFTASKEYEQFLVKSALALKEAMKPEKITYFLRSEDMKYADVLKKTVADCRVESDSEILLGGLRAVDAVSSVCGDDTLDARLSEEAKKFAEKSDLKIY